MAQVLVTDSNLSGIADAIRAKNGGTATYKPSEMAAAIAAISTSSGSDFTLQSKTATPSESSQTIVPDSGYDGLSSVTVGAISSSYIGSSVTQKAAATYTPTTSNQTIAAGQYLAGAQTIKGDSNLTAANIKSGTSIFGVTGTYEGDSGIDTSDATAAAENIESGYTAYVNGELVTGSIASAASATLQVEDVDYVTDDVGTPYIRFSYLGEYTKRIIGGGNTFNQDLSAVNFGDAEASDVASGKTFTSAAGLKVTGTATSSGSSTNNVEAYEVDATDLTVTFSGSGSTIKVWGYAVGTSSSSSFYSTTTRYAFYGSYYVRISTTTATENELSVTIDDDGAISGLPSDMTSGTLLVVMSD